MTRTSLVPNLVAIALVCGAWFLLGLAVDNAYYRLMLTTVPIWAVLATSWNVFSGYSGLVSFGHATFFGLGAFTVALGTRDVGLTPWLGIPLGTAIGAGAALAIGIATFRLRGIYFALAMLAYPLALVYLFTWLGLAEVTLPLVREDPAWSMQFADGRPALALAVILLAGVLLISLRIERSRFGLSLLAIKQNELAAEAAGIDTVAWKMRAITLSGAIAATAGGLYATILLVVTPDSVFGLVVSAEAMILALFGGAGTLWGPLIGAAVLVPLSEVLRAEFGDTLPGLQGILYGLALILVILLAPEGIYWRLSDLWRRERAAPLPDAPIPAPLPQRAAPVAAEGGMLLTVEGVSKRYGGLRAVEAVSFGVASGEIVGIIGPNGAGKTTLFNLLNGVVRPSAGRVLFKGRDITGRRPSEICRAGIARTFQTVRAFPRLSLLQNVAVGAFVAHGTDGEAEAAARAALARVGLLHRAEAPAGSLTTKELRLMELARALASRPTLILMDEPLAGLGGAETDEMIALVRTLPGDGITVLIIEHTMKAMVSTVDRFVVLDHGELLTQGAPGAVTRDPKVVEAYLGRKWMKAHAPA